jgi:ParB-like chromosome segregation protein Spo0J
MTDLRGPGPEAGFQAGYQEGYDKGFEAGMRAAREWMPDNVASQPVSQVRWIERDRLHANDYNPNRVAPPERKLLVTSILEDGWTQPVVIRPRDRDEPIHFEIVDGFHRWQASENRDVYDLTDGLVPTVHLRLQDAAHQRMSTIRHNRARGTHHVVRMADIVAELEDAGISEAEMIARLGMSDEEVRRLAERGKMTERGRAEGMGEAWRPAPREG